ncbi:MAG: hypothetical protein AAFN27_22025 [Pseudomonadota bacterium]
MNRRVGAAPISVANRIGWASAHHGLKPHQVSASLAGTQTVGCALRTIPTGQGRTPLVEINNTDQLKEWLTEHSQKDVGVIASRVALRALPFVVPFFRPDYNEDPYPKIMAVFRGCQFACIASTSTIEPLRSIRVSENIYISLLRFNWISDFYSNVPLGPLTASKTARNSLKLFSRGDENSHLESFIDSVRSLIEHSAKFADGAEYRSAFWASVRQHTHKFLLFDRGL